MISDGVLIPVEDDLVMYQFGRFILLFICSSCCTGASAKIIPELYNIPTENVQTRLKK